LELELPWGLTHFLLRYEYLALFCLFIISEAGVPIPLPTNLMLMYCAFLATQGGGSVALILLSSLCGMMVGAMLLFSVCRWGGPKLLAKYGKYIKLTPERVAKVEAWFKRWGSWAVFLGRLSPGVRIHQTAVAAGMFRVRTRTFFLSAIVAGFLWITFYIWMGYLFKQGYEGFNDFFKSHYEWFIPVLVFFVLLLCTGIFLFLRRRRRNRLQNLSESKVSSEKAPEPTIH
jgi:membrane protein DedA with SNARE-associated domain